MPRTPDQFPGERREEGILFYSGSQLPATPGEQLYVSGSSSGSGFFFNEKGYLAQPVRLPNITGMVPFMVENTNRWVPALPITGPSGWLVNNVGVLLVSASIDY